MKIITFFDRSEKRKLIKKYGRWIYLELVINFHIIKENWKYILTATSNCTETSSRVLQPPGYIVLGDEVLTWPLHDSCQFFSKRLKTKDTITFWNKFPYLLSTSHFAEFTLITIFFYIAYPTPNSWQIAEFYRRMRERERDFFGGCEIVTYKKAEASSTLWGWRVVEHLLSRYNNRYYLNLSKTFSKKKREKNLFLT